MAQRRGPQRPTKKHQARLEREQRQQRIIIIGTISVLVIVVGLILFGFIQANFIQPRTPVAEVNEETILAGEFVARTKFERNNLVQQALNSYQTLQFISEEQSDLQLNILNNIQQIAFQLDPTSFGREVLNTMIDDVLIQQEAMERGITVPDEEITKEIQRQFGYVGEDPLPTPTSFPTANPTSTLSALQLDLVTPIPSPTNFPTSTPDAEATPTELPSPTSTLEPTLTPTPFTEEAFQELYEETLAGFEDQIGVTEEDIREIIRAELYRQRLQNEFAGEVPLTQEQVWARHILVEDEQTANQILQQLEDGADWNQLAAEFSQDTSNKDQGGDLGWFRRGMMVPEFENTAFELDIGEISDPVQTQFGWHIIQVLGKEDRQISEFEYQQQLQQAFLTWLDSVRQEANIEIFEAWTDVVPSEPSIPETLLQSLGS